MAGRIQLPSVMIEPLAWDEVAARLTRVLGEPVSGGLPLTPGWSSRMTWAAHGERAGSLVVKARSGERAYEKTAWCAARLPLLAARGYPVPAIIWHGMARDQWHVTVQNRLPGYRVATLDGRLLEEVRTSCSITGTRYGPMPSGPTARCAPGSGAGCSQSGDCGCRRTTTPTTT